jgi:release factor glutamine methyltransferase
MPGKPAAPPHEAVRTVGTTLAGLVPRLESVSETPGLDAQVLLARIMEKPRSWVLAHPEAPLTRTRANALEGMVRRLERGNPLPYVLGNWEFFGLEFEVTPDVLIPRPETELLVERAIAWLRANPSRRRAVDVGTGSGCIAVSLAANLPDIRVMATDISPAALAVAGRNAEKNRVAGRVEYCCCDLFPDRVGFDLILANLPYIPTETLKKLPICGREPALALDGGPDGLAVIRRLLEQVPDRLMPGGLLLMELEASQGPRVLSLAYDGFSEAEIHLHQDLAERDRLLEVQV